MSDIYGTINVTLSSNFRGALEDLQSRLTQFSWSDDVEHWWLNKAEQKIYCQYGFSKNLQYPAAFPSLRYAIDTKDENLIHKRIFNPTSDEILSAIENGEDILTEPCDLEKVYEKIIPAIQEGWIEIACFENYKGEFFRASTLLIDSESNSKFTIFFTGDRDTPSYITETHFCNNKSSLSNFFQEV